MVRPLNASGHKNLNLSEVYIINYIGINIRDAKAMAPIEKENPVMSRDADIGFAAVLFNVSRIARESTQAKLTSQS